MLLNSYDFKNYLGDVIDTLQIKNYPHFVKESLKPGPTIVEKKKIINSCENLLSVLIGNTKVLGSYHKKWEKKERLKKKYGNEPMNKTDAIDYTGYPKSTFEKKVNADIKVIINGKPHFKIVDLDKIMELIIDSSESALCIETYYCYDGNRRGFLPFEIGEYYKVVDEDETSKYVFNEKWNVILRVGNQSFRNNFRVYEDLDLIVSQFNERERLKSSNETSQKSSLFYTVNKAAALLSVSKQTIHNLIDSGKIASRSIDGNIRFTYEDLKVFCLTVEPNLAVCLENFIYIDKEKQYVVAFEKDKIYKITNENNIYVSLFSNKCGKSARFTKKRFGKFFHIAEDWQIEPIKYSFDKLG